MNPSIPVTAITDLLTVAEQAVQALHMTDDHHLANKLGVAAAKVRGTLDEVAPRVDVRQAA